MYMYMYMHTYRYTHTHTNAYIHTYICIGGPGTAGRAGYRATCSYVYVHIYNMYCMYVCMYMQVVSGDSWASGVSRDMFVLDDTNTKKTDTGVAFFFVSYLCLCSIVLLNVVVAVLLDEFISSVLRFLRAGMRAAAC